MQFWWKRKESELDREMRYHLESLAEAFERQGDSRAEAMARARREFGGVEQVKERCRDERRWRPAAEFSRDLGYGWRMLRKAPAVSGMAVLSLALGIGATTAIVSLADAVLWRSLAVPAPEQLSEILWQSKGRSRDVFSSSSGSMYPEGPLHVADFFSHLAFDTLRERMAGRAEVAAHRDSNQVSISFEGASSVANLRPVSGNFFPLLGVQPALGRLLISTDDRASAPFVAVATHRFWRTGLRGDPKTIGRAMRINNRSYTIAGVLPERFGGISPGESTDLYTTIEHSPGMLDPNSWERTAATDPFAWGLQLLARRAPGVSNDQLRAGMDPVFRSTWAGQPKDPATTPEIRVQDAANGIGGVRRELGNPLTMLFVLVTLVLLVACANIANLLLARSDARRKEVALRLSLGCSRARLMRQFLTESLLLAGCGGLLSIAVTYAVANFAVTLMPGSPRLDFSIDPRMVFATLAVTALTAAAFGVYPAWSATRVDAAPALKEGGGSVGGVRHGFLTPGKLLVLAQVSLGVLLVAAAAAFTAHLRKTLSAETGFDRTRLLLFDLRPGESGYRGDRLKDFYLRLERRLSEVPQVKTVGLARIRPMKGGGYFDGIAMPGRTARIGTAVNFVSASYLDALGVSIVDGRGIEAREVREGARVAVVSEDFAAELGRNPLGVAFQMDGKPVEIVGVAARARYGRLNRQENVLYLPNSLGQDSITVVLRTAAKPLQALAGVREAVASLDPNLPIVNAVTMEQQIASTLRREILFAWLCGAFGVLALILCMVGLYGVMSYAVSRRRQEIGVRIALGASPRDVWRLVVAEGLGVTLAGCGLGILTAWWAAQKFLDYRRLAMDPVEPWVLVWAAAALVVSAALALLGPAIRAASTDPVKSLREG